MSGLRKSPQGRDRAIGAQLRTIRIARTTLNLEAAAAEVGWSPATLSRTENGKRHITSEDVASLLTAYRIPAAERTRLVESARVTAHAGWWSKRLPGAEAGPIVLATYEADAHSVTSWELGLVPGLLQTRDYSVAFMTLDGCAPEVAEARWEVRRQRQRILAKVDYTAFVHEAVLYTPFGGRSAMKRQLRHLCEAPDRGVAVRVVRMGRPHMTAMHSWLLLEFPDASPLVHVELQYSTVDLHDNEAKPYLDLRDWLAKIALTTSESRALIKEVADRV